MSTIERLKDLVENAVTANGYARHVALDPEEAGKVLAVIEAAKETAPFCEEPTVTELGFVPCDVCPECILRLSLAALDEGTE
jgi:hypothetical protein